MWASSWNKLNQNLSASFPRAVRPTTILLPSINVAPWRNDPLRWGTNTKAIPQSASSFFNSRQNTSGLISVISLIFGNTEINFLILIGDVLILLDFIFASCAHASSAKSLFSVIAKRLHAILVIWLLSRSFISITSKYFLRFITFSLLFLASGTHPSFAISL